MELTPIAFKDVQDGKSYLLKLYAPDCPSRGQWWKVQKYHDGYFEYQAASILVRYLEIYELPQ